MKPHLPAAGVLAALAACVPTRALDGASAAADISVAEAGADAGASADGPALPNGDGGPAGDAAPAGPILGPPFGYGPALIVDELSSGQATRVHYTYDAQARVEESVADDVATGGTVTRSVRTQFFYDGEGRIARTLGGAALPSGTWATDSRAEWSYDPTGRATLIVQSTSPGRDGVSFVEVVRDTLSYGSPGIPANALQQHSTGPGAWTTDHAHTYYGAPLDEDETYRDPGGATFYTFYRYDALGRLDHVTEVDPNATTTTRYSYDAQGRVTLGTPSCAGCPAGTGARTRYVYDASGRLGEVIEESTSSGGPWVVGKHRTITWSPTGSSYTFERWEPHPYQAWVLEIYGSGFVYRRP